MSYLIVCVGRNCASYVPRCLRSINSLRGDWRACIVDDASDDATWDAIQETSEDFDLSKYVMWHNDSVQGAMKNQRDAWLALEPKAKDVIVWVDLDDRLAHDSVLDVLDRYYRNNILVTYGSYEPEPASDTCPLVTAYPHHVMRQGTLRRFINSGGGLRYNHLRTVTWQVLRQLTDDDMKDDDGNWWSSGPDAAVMIPALELAGTRYAVIPETLYIYSSDNGYSEWRRHPELVNKNHRQMLARPPKRRLR